MSNHDNGGPAFPVQSIYVEDQDTNSPGMSLRDYFAALAMQGMLADGETCPTHRLAQSAYEVADAMLQARAEREAMAKDAARYRA